MKRNSAILVAEEKGVAVESLHRKRTFLTPESKRHLEILRDKDYSTNNFRESD